MKKIILLAMTSGLLTIQSCYDNKSAGSETDDQSKVLLAGKIYALRPDTILCAQIEPNTGYLRTLLFLDDSLFIQIIPNSCNDIGHIYTCTQFYSGKYKTDYNNLTLIFNKKKILNYTRIQNNAQNDTLSSLAHLEPEESDMLVERLGIIFCESTPYFDPCDAQRHMMAPTTDLPAPYIKYLKDAEIWDQLFYKK